MVFTKHDAELVEQLASEAGWAKDNRRVQDLIDRLNKAAAPVVRPRGPGLKAALREYLGSTETKGILENARAKE